MSLTVAVVRPERSGLRWGELVALTIPQIGPGSRCITVDRKVVEVAGHLDVEALTNRK